MTEAQKLEYLVLNDFESYIKDKLVEFKRGQIISWKVAASWPNLPQMLGYLLIERRSAADAGGEE